jgi:hypothetical protein
MFSFICQVSPQGTQRVGQTLYWVFFKPLKLTFKLEDLSEADSFQSV